MPPEPNSTYETASRSAYMFGSQAIAKDPAIASYQMISSERSSFGRCTPELQSQRRGIAVDYENHPSDLILLSHVCSQWRTLVAYQTPTFWTQICPLFPEQDGSRPDNLDAEMLNLWFQRSQNLPLSIDFADPVCMTAYGATLPEAVGMMEGFAGILKAITSQSRRWKKIVLRLGPYLFHEQWSVLMGEVFSRFNSSSAPHLRVITLNCSWHKSTWIPSFPRGQLTTIYIRGAISSKQFLEMIAGCKNLRECSIARVWYIPSLERVMRGNQYRPKAIIKVPKLRILAIHAMGTAQKIFNYLSLPSLTSLAIILDDRPPAETHKTWKVILLPAFLHLTHLAIQPVTNEMLGALTWLPEDARRSLELSAPRSLHHLSVPHLTGFQADKDVLLNMLASRMGRLERNPSYGLRHVHLTDVGEEIEAITRELQVKLPGLAMNCPWDDE
ncbi:hypothetical protein BKA70DRAFT_1490927 [Coprinopsis sp. MPI-PUGE-AT-0042]|nr:hypothetical protein BKA70DRAFT_1490927 [Coprinopsis sp. MPI-PUGE-AT-0042]